MLLIVKYLFLLTYGKTIKYHNVLIDPLKFSKYKSYFGSPFFLIFILPNPFFIKTLG